MMTVKAEGIYPVKVPHSPSTQKEGFIAARAHHIHPGNNSPLKAVITRKLYHGNITEYHAQLDQGSSVRMNISDDYNRDIDDNVTLEISKAVWLDE